VLQRVVGLLVLMVLAVLLQAWTLLTQKSKPCGINCQQQNQGQDMHTRFAGDAVAIAVDLAEELPGFEEVAGFVPDFPPTAEFDDLSAGFGEAMSGFAGCFASALCVRRKRNTSIQQVLPNTKDNEAGPHFIPLVRRELHLKVH
jgi:hypothetical protein